ncbi:MAG: CGNR zinc finger domain-containing protein [Candidatus Binataceae bacterium]
MMVRIESGTTRTLKANGASLVVAPRRELCLDFANTVEWRGSAPADSLHGFPDLLRWCEANGVLTTDASGRASDWSLKHPAEAAAIFTDAVTLREAIYRIFFRTAESKAPDARDVAEVNAALERAPVRRVLAHAGKGFGWRLDRDGRSAAALLAPVLWSAGDLLVGPDAVRMRHCSNDKCLWLFLDDSKNGSRRWCSMQACGNRAKAHRHYLKQKSA